MSYETYKILHIVSVLAVFIAFGGLLALNRVGAAKGSSIRKLMAITHGVALVLVLVAGVGTLHKMTAMPWESGWPNWAVAKIVVWFALGAILAPIRRKPQWADGLLVACLALGGLATWLAIAKPF